MTTDISNPKFSSTGTPDPVAMRKLLDWIEKTLREHDAKQAAQVRSEKPAHWIGYPTK